MRFLFVLFLVGAATAAYANNRTIIIESANTPTNLVIQTGAFPIERFRSPPNTIALTCRTGHTVTSTSYADIPEMIRQMNNFCLQQEAATLAPAGSNVRIVQQAGQNCLNYQQMVQETHDKAIVEGSACQQPNGTWELKNQ